MNKRLEGKRVLVTQARDFMCPALCDVLVEHGAIVLADESPLSAPAAAERVVRAATMSRSRAPIGRRPG